MSAVKSSKRTKQGEAGLRKGDWARAYRECDRRRADEEAKHVGDRSRVCDVRELVRASHLGRLQKLPRLASEDFGDEKRRINGHAIDPKKKEYVDKQASKTLTPRVEKIVFCLTGPYLTRRATLELGSGG